MFVKDIQYGSYMTFRRISFNLHNNAFISKTINGRLYLLINYKFYQHLNNLHVVVFLNCKLRVLIWSSGVLLFLSFLSFKKSHIYKKGKLANLGKNTVPLF